MAFHTLHVRCPFVLKTPILLYHKHIRKQFKLQNVQIYSTNFVIKIQEFIPAIMLKCSDHFQRNFRYTKTNLCKYFIYIKPKLTVILPTIILKHVVLL